MKRNLLCLVALLPVFSAYCEPHPLVAYSLPLRNSGLILSEIVNIDRKTNTHRFSDSQLLCRFFRIDYDRGTALFESSLFYKSRRTVYSQINFTLLSRHLGSLPINSPGTTVLIKEQFFKNFQQVDYRKSVVYNPKKERTGFGRGAAIGAIVGAGIGLIAGFAYGGNPESSYISTGSGALMGALAGAIIGVIIGGTIGALTKKRT